MKPLCFVLMPFSSKPDPTGGKDIDFDQIYRNAIMPAIEDAGMDPIRADEEKTGGIIHKPMFERLLLCEFAVADLTTANANVFYELGVRHTARPSTTVTIFAERQPIPFDINFLRSLPYDLGRDNEFGAELAAKLRGSLAEVREKARRRDTRKEADALLRDIRTELGFALNRSAAKDPAARAKALQVLTGVETRQGASSETCGLIGRIHKDYWTEALEDGNEIEAAGHLTNAIDAYLRGFMADQRDAYPGINAVTLLEIRGDDASLQTRDRLTPVVRFAVERRLDEATADYWDHATMVELAVLSNDPAAAAKHLAHALATVREAWEPETTENNLKLIARARRKRGEATDWLDQIIAALKKKRSDMS